MKRIALLLSFALAVWASATSAVFAQDAYREGSVWSVSLIKVKPGMFDAYMRDLTTTRKPLMEEAQKQGLILSHRMLAGNSMGRDDFNMILLVEYKNWAAYDGLTAKFDALNNRLIGNEDKRTQIMVKRGDMREILGAKDMQEVHFR